MQVKKLPISVNICTFNEENDIEECIDNVLKANPTEIIVIDGGSDDNTLEILKKYNDVRVIVSDAKGLSGQRQIGLLESNSEFIALIDADDVIDGDFLKTLYSEINLYKIDAIQATIYPFQPVTYWQRAMGYLHLKQTYNKNVKPSKMVGRPSLYRRDKLLKCGFDIYFNGVGGEDTDLAIRMEQNGNLQGLGTAISYRKQSKSFVEIYKKIIKYGKGDAHIIVKHPHKIKSIVFHQLIRYPFIYSLKALNKKGFIFIPFYMVFGFMRFINMCFYYREARNKGIRFGY